MWGGTAAGEESFFRRSTRGPILLLWGYFLYYLSLVACIL